MVKIAIIGWYGTETIGDRAILAGILRILSGVFPSYEIELGSLAPDFSNRTILEDYEFLCNCSCNSKLKINIFDTLNASELRKIINDCDCLMIGGGPLMDIKQMYMLEYGFGYAKKKGKKTVALGCGWGPLNNAEYKRCALNILDDSDLVIFRDSTSLSNARFNFCNESSDFYSLIDPAFISANYYKKTQQNTIRSNDLIALNFRDISSDCYGGDNIANIILFENIILQILSNYNEPLHLIPMHTYFIGGDDRIILNRLNQNIGSDRIVVHNMPLGLEDTMSLYYNAKFCVGMRFHSIVLQTVLNGCNYILDYSDINNGKIVSMIKDCGMEMSDNRYLSLHNKSEEFKFPDKIERKSTDDIQIETFESKYVNLLERYLK